MNSKPTIEELIARIENLEDGMAAMLNWVRDRFEFVSTQIAALGASAVANGQIDVGQLQQLFDPQFDFKQFLDKLCAEPPTVTSSSAWSSDHYIETEETPNDTNNNKH